MTVHSNEAQRPANDRQRETSHSTSDLGGQPAREHKLKDSIHPSLRALPDYPAR